jgi:hypothetical protein
MRLPWLSALVLVAACGTPPPRQEEERFHVVGVAPTVGEALTQQELALDGTVTELGVSTAGDLVAVAGDRVYERTAGVLTLRNLYAEGSDPTSLGAVSAIIPRAKGGAWIAAANGLFELEGLYVTHSPVVVGMGPLLGACEVAQGGMNGLWLATSDGVYRRQDTDTFRYRIDGWAEAANGVAGDPDGVAALVVLGGQLVLLVPGSDATLAAAAPPDEVGRVNAVAAAKGALYAASERGLYRWQPSATPQWTRFPLGGAEGLEVKVDPVTASAWVVTSDALLRLDGDALTSFARPAGTSRLAVDRLGDVWTAKGQTLVQVKAGARSTDAKFEAEVKPWLVAHCTMCHSDFVDPVVFGPKAELALQRVRTGDMPRCSGGVPCPEDQHLMPEEWAVLESWIRGGKQP